jgi:PPK2 family polyphosphate:nucleotide phosphotransferase
MSANRVVEQSRLQPRGKVELQSIDPADTAGYSKESAGEQVDALLPRLTELQEMLYACREQAVLVLLQGIDAAGKDGAIKRVMGAFNPQGVSVHAWKAPAGEELAHDYLWRIHRRCPQRGQIGIFNRSQYEDVLSPLVHGRIDKATAKQRYRQINDFERMLSENGTTVVKFFLLISSEEQRERLQERIDDPTKHWKADLKDLDEREHWDAYIEAYEALIAACNTEWAPWHVVRADKKWFRDLVVASVLVERLEALGLAYPPPREELRGLRVE